MSNTNPGGIVLSYISIINNMPLSRGVYINYMEQNDAYTNDICMHIYNIYSIRAYIQYTYILN